MRFLFNAEGTDIYRLVSPNLYVWEEIGEGADYKPGAYNIDFHLSADGTVKLDDGLYDVGMYYGGSPYYYMYYTSAYPAYCGVTNEDGFITVYGLLYDEGDLYPVPVPFFTFDWTEGYPY